MRFIDRNSWLTLGLGAILLSGCSGSMVDLDSPEHAQMLKQDRLDSGQEIDSTGQIIQLSLEAAIQRGYTNNLDARVAAYEAMSQQDEVTLADLRALPGVEASGGYVKRSNSGASSSRSVITGQQSLEPSQSTETDRRVASLEASWNLLDAALALADASKANDEAKIAGQRYAKVMQNVERDVYSAYWRARGYQDSREQSERLLKECESRIQNLDTAANQKLISSDQAGDKMAMLSDRMRTLRDLHDKMQLSEIELKGMLSIPLGARLELTTKQRDIAADIKRLTTEDVENQEWTALQSRPEMREEVLKKNVSLHETRREIYQTFPGINLLLSKNYDSNQFLVDPNWVDFSAKIAQSITGIFTLPARYAAAKNKEVLADARRQALNSAILAQVHIARERLGSTSDANRADRVALMAASRKSNGIAGKAAEGFASKQDAFLAKLDSQIETMRAATAYADMQDAYAAMKTTLGGSVISNRTVQMASTGSLK